MTPSDIRTGTGTGPRATAAPSASAAALAPAVGTAILMMAIIQVGLVVKGNAPVLDGVLIDPDGYMRLARVAQLWQDGNWFEPVFTGSARPRG